MGQLPHLSVILGEEGARALRQRLEALATGVSASSAAFPTGLTPIDGVLPRGGLAYGQVHEWIGVEPSIAGAPHASAARLTHWAPPLTLLLEVAWRGTTGVSGGAHGRAVWIGERVWPYPACLGRVDSPCRLDLDACLFVRAPAPADRLWATDLALRSRAARVVVVDGSGLDLASTRRLQLAAEIGGGVCLLARPPREQDRLTASATRWRVSHAPCPSPHRRWTVELVRCKGMPPSTLARSAWILEQDRETRALRVVADVLDRSGESPAREGAHRRTG